MITLYDFQQEDVDKLVQVPNVLNASEMGYGKTVVAGEIDAHRRKAAGGKAPTLIIAPLSGTMNTWRKHYKNQYPELKGIVFNTKNRQEFFNALGRTDWYDYYIIHWDMLSRTVAQLQRVRWNHIIADECHRAKNRKAQATVALKQIRTNHKTALSGTPVTNKPHELWSILNWLYPSDWRGYWPFYKKYVDFEIKESWDGTKAGYHIINGPNMEALPELRERMQPFYVRHLKRGPCCLKHPQGVMPWLPDKTYADVIEVDLSPKQRRAYDQMKKDMLAWVGEQGDKPIAAPVAIAKLVRLQQLALAHADIDDDWNIHLVEPSTKLDALMEMIKDNEDEQFVVFSQFSKMIKLLGHRLAKAKISHGLFTGETKPSDRVTMVEDFQAGRIRIFAGTIKAGGVGLDLFNASRIVFLDRSWSPAENLQAEDRLWRHGQKNPVTVYDIVARDTIDRGRNQHIEMKWEWIRLLLGDK